MMTIIERTSKDLQDETIELFNECKPLIDEGYSMTHAIRTVKNLRPGNGFTDTAWYKRFKEYAATQGYHPQLRRKK